MTDNNDDTPTKEVVIDLDRFRKDRTTNISSVEEKAIPQEHTFEFHLLTGEEGTPDEVVKATGYLKFGPQFLVVVTDYETASDVVLSVQLPIVKYVKRLDESGAIQGTLSL